MQVNVETFERIHGIHIYLYVAKHEFLLHIFRRRIKQTVEFVTSPNNIFNRIKLFIKDIKIRNSVFPNKFHASIYSSYEEIQATHMEFCYYTNVLQEIISI